MISTPSREVMKSSPVVWIWYEMYKNCVRATGMDKHYIAYDYIVEHIFSDNISHVCFGIYIVDFSSTISVSVCCLSDRESVSGRAVVN